MNAIIPVEIIEKRIYLIRGEKVMLDRDLAGLYGVKTFNLNKAVKRNLNRFPQEFVFQLTKEEWENLRFQTGISSWKSQNVTSNWGGRRYLPYVFTELGVAMLSSVLNSDRAIEVNILIILTFVKLRKLVASPERILKRIDEMERKYDKQFKIVFDTLRDIVIPQARRIKKIGFLR